MKHNYTSELKREIDITHAGMYGCVGSKLNDAREPLPGKIPSYQEMRVLIEEKDQRIKELEEMVSESEIVFSGRWFDVRNSKNYTRFKSLLNSYKEKYV